MFRIADFLFINDYTITDVLHYDKNTQDFRLNNSSVLDKIIDGAEYQLCKRNNLVESFENIGIILNNVDKIKLKELVPPILNDYINLSRLIEIFSSVGIFEKLPANRKYIDYIKIDGPRIRLFNKINQNLIRENYDIVDFIGLKNIEKINLISSSKEYHLQVVKVNTFANILCDKKIIRNGKYLDEEFLDLITVSQSCDNYVLISKLKNILSDLKNNLYF